MIPIKPYGDLSSDELLKLEEKIGFALPSDYRDFLKISNGGRVLNQVFHVDDLEQDILMNVFYGYNVSQDKVLNLLFWFDKYQDEIPEHSLLIGNDPGGGFILYIPYGEDCGVYYYDDSYFFEQSSDEQNTYFIAETFQEFLGLLKEFKPAS
ncbi:SMI1/KNR4 family protein [Fibrella forsythiae]|uniref:SMI1/KNR4 family protein n=1 Tax=Fibrella forsythiae TaxID=2817061 RepID=A0ABS3JMV6_9BACT|nr:SMI1/KNR4 family protein [Fibrella forsythiae]MBO0950803.1 SMI1/KNR4 family protein [Fibrella forsythiae]